MACIAGRRLLRRRLLRRLLREADVVLASWRNGDAGEDPLDALDTELGEVEIKDVIADHAAANLAWDYDLGSEFSAQMREFEGTFAHRDTRYTSAAEDEDDWWVHTSDAPASFGYHYVQLPGAVLERVRMGQDIAMAIEPDFPEGLPTTLRFRGREMAHQDLGMNVLNRVKDDLEKHAKVEQYPRMEGRQMVMVLVPR